MHITQIVHITQIHLDAQNLTVLTLSSMNEVYLKSSSIGIGPVSSAIWVCRSALARFRARPLAELESFRQVGG